MKLHFIDRYDALVKTLLFGTQEFQRGLYINTAGVASIGFNFDLQNENTVDRILEAMNFDPQAKVLDGEAYVAEQYYIGLLKSAFYHSSSADLESLKTVVENILQTRRDDQRYHQYPQFSRIEKFRFSDAGKAQALCYILTKKYEKIVDDWITGFGFDILRNNSHLLSRNSAERAVLVSLAAQGLVGFDEFGTPLSIPLANTLIDDNRPEAWYQIRYGLVAKKKLTENSIKRQFFESEIFGLYEEGITARNIGRDYCKKIYSMYNLYKEQILYFERNYNYLVAEASKQFRFNKITVRTLEQNFDLAYNNIRNASHNSNLLDNYLDVMEKGMDELVDIWSQDDDLDHDIAVAS